MDNDGYVTKSDIVHILKMMVGPQIITDRDLERIATATLRESDHDNDGKVSLDDFSTVSILSFQFTILKSFTKIIQILSGVDWSKLNIEF